jgi:hypothetical protein
MIHVYCFNTRRAGNIAVVHGPLDGPNRHALWAIHIYRRSGVQD